jgi:hypothetical protein
MKYDTKWPSKGSNMFIIEGKMKGKENKEHEHQSMEITGITAFLYCFSSTIQARQQC